MSKLLKVAISALSLISITTIPQSAFAAVSCEANTANNHSNGSLASCVLSFDQILDWAIIILRVNRKTLFFLTRKDNLKVVPLLVI